MVSGLPRAAADAGAVLAGAVAGPVQSAGNPAAAAASLAVEAGPLARAAGAECRRQLKMAGAAPSAGEAAELQEEPAARRRRLDALPAVSPFFVLQPYPQHKVAYVGRNLWCLDCFEVPRSAHRSWRHGRCGGAKPPMSMPPALRDSILRQPLPCPKLQACIRSRWTVLAGASGLH